MGSMQGEEKQTPQNILMGRRQGGKENPPKKKLNGQQAGRGKKTEKNP